MEMMEGKLRKKRFLETKCRHVKWCFFELQAAWSSSKGGNTIHF